MIEYINGDIFDSECICLVNPVNCVGVMGAGLALQFRKRFPKNYYVYKIMCENYSIGIGRPMFCKEGGKVIIDFPTKYHYRNKSKLEDIDKALCAIPEILNKIFNGTIPIKNTIAFPAIGCGLGGLEWSQVKNLIENRLGNYPFTVKIYLNN